MNLAFKHLSPAGLGDSVEERRMEQGGGWGRFSQSDGARGAGGGDLERWQWALKKRRNTTKCDFTTTGGSELE